MLQSIGMTWKQTRKNGTMRKLCTGCREPDTYSDIGNYFRADIDKRLDKCRDFLFVIYISINIVYCILHCGSSDYFDDYYFRFFTVYKKLRWLRDYGL